jgi:tellurite resistance protein TerC
VTTLALWGGFTLLVLALLALDLGVLNRRAVALSLRMAATMTAFWAVVATAFGVGLFAWRGPEDGVAFFAGYLLEYSLSLDNVFFFVLIFGAFGVPAALQRRVLLWGVLGALVLRGLMIVAGVALIERFEAILYLFGVFLVVSGIRMALQRVEVRPAENRLTALFRRLVPVTEGFEGDRFVVRRGGQLMATPLLVVLLTIESTDLAFAIDSIPAVFAITTDGFVVFSSNVLAVLGLRSLYFVVSGAVGRLYYLRLGLAAILVFVGLEMALARWVELPVAVSLLAIVLCVGIAALASALRARWLAEGRRASPASAGRLCELPRTEFAPDEAFGGERRLRPAGPDDRAWRPVAAPLASGRDGEPGSRP